MWTRNRKSRAARRNQRATVIQAEQFEKRLLLTADFTASFGDVLAGQSDNSVVVDLPNAASGVLDAWVDYDGDGQFHGAREQILTSVALVQGSNELQFEIPFAAIGADRQVRLTVSTPDPDTRTINSQLTINTWLGEPVPDVRRTVATSFNPFGVISADFNNDGDVDVFASNITGSRVEYYDNQGDGFFTTNDVNTSGLANSLQKFEVADINNDGLLDVVAGTTGSNNIVEAYIQQPVGQFTRTSFPSVESSEFVEIADFNGDGHPDIITADRDVAVLLNDGDGTFTASSVDIVNPFPGGLAVGDVDNDGDIDAVATNGFEIILYRNDGAGNFATINNFITPTEILNQVHILDFDGDGNTDIVGGRFILGNIFLFRNNGTSFSEQAMNIEGGRDDIEFGDVNGDGLTDILTANTLDGSEIYVNTGDNLTFNRINLHMDSGEYIEAADFDGDGDIDFLYEEGIDLVLRLNNSVNLSPFRIVIDSATVDEDTGTVTGTVTRPLGSGTANELIVTLSSSDVTRGTVPATVPIPAGSQSAPFTITIADDDIVNGDRLLAITAGVVGNIPGTADVTITDDDIAGFTITETDSSTVVGENGTTDSFTVVLDAAPESDVVIDLINPDSGQISLDVSSLTFTPTNWNTEQTVNVVAIDDAFADGTVAVAINATINDATSDDFFDAVADQQLAIDATDNETAGYTVSETTVTVSETGTAQSVEIVLTAQPLNDVIFNVSSADTDEVTASPATITFTSANWNFAQLVTVTGVDDDVIDGDQQRVVTVSVDASADPSFRVLAPASITATIEDDDVAGLTVSSTAISIDEDAGSDTFNVSLSRAPLSDVTLLVSSENTAEVTSTPATLLFTPANWNVPQTVTVDGVGNDVVDGDQMTNIIIAVDDANSDPAYQGLDDQTVEVTTVDNDSVGVTITESASMVVSETGTTTTTFEVVLESAPASQVVINIVPDDAGELSVDLNSLTFTADNWNVAQQVTVSGVDDAIDDGDVQSDITISVDASSDPVYAALDSQTVTVTNEDDDTAGFSVTPSALFVSESGTTNTLEIVLESEPVSDVTVEVLSANMDELTTAPATVVFTSANWNQPQTVTLSAVDDAIVDGNQTVTVTATITDDSDPQFTGLNDRSINFNVIDNDVVGTTITLPDPFSVTEAGTSNTFEISLNSAPLSDVILDLESLDTGEFTVSPASITFTPTDWNVQQVITVTGVDDVFVDGTQTVDIQITVNAASDPVFASLPAEQVSLDVEDDDVAGFSISPTTDLTLTEGQTGQSFEIVLDAAPTTDVVLLIGSDDATVATPDQASITFTQANWDQPQSVLVSSPDNFVIDGTRQAVITVQVDSASNPAFTGLTAETRNVTVTDDDSAGFIVGDDVTVSESGTTSTVTVMLSIQPLTDVTINVAGSDDGEFTIDVASLQFTPANWNVAQTVTVTGIDDSVRDGDISGSITFSVDSQSDPQFQNLESQDVAVTVSDDEETSFTFGTTNGQVSVSEQENTDTVTIALGSEPLGSVVITVATSDDTEFIVDTSTLTFTPDNWDQPQTVTIQGLVDTLRDGDQTSQLLITVDDSVSDPVWRGGTAQLDVVTTDNPFSLDVDADDALSPLTDGILILRHLAGFTNDSLVNGAVSPNGQRLTAVEVDGFLTDRAAMLDIDGDGESLSLTDGILALRYLAGFRGTSLIAGAVNTGATRDTAEEIEAWFVDITRSDNDTQAAPVAAAGPVPVYHPPKNETVFHPMDEDVDDFFATTLTPGRGTHF